jgi:hypothetical protein
MGTSMNGWTRIGIVLFCINAVYVVGYFAYEYHEASTWRAPATYSGDFIYEYYSGRTWECVQKPKDPMVAEDLNFAYCPTGLKADLLPKSRLYRWGDFALALFVPVLLPWILVLGSIRIIRWIASGFRSQSES